MLRRVHRGLLVPEMAFLPIIALALHFVFVGVRLVSPTHLQAHHNTLGRFMFIAALVILGGSLAAVARPRWPNLTAPGGLAVRRTDVGIQLSILLSTILPAALAALGFYVTAILIAYQALRMAWLAFGVILAAGMIARWMAIRERRRRSALAGAEPDAEAVTAESQTRGFLQFMLAVVVAIGLYGIWSDAFPMLVMLKRVELWSRFQVSDPIRDPLEEADLRGPEDVPPAERAPDAATRPEGLSLPGVGSGGAVAPATESAPLTLWNLLQAILVAIVVTVLTRSLPGVIDLLLRRRENIDRGARVAFTTLVRYTILIVGVSTVFGLLGVSWSKVQWLAAALTFGLGFGLQEIVANFVSGLILLLERPVRVGDAVTVGNLGGIVSQIQIRATTITLWDRSEMIVPNKEFITTKLINWTLSNSNRRSEIAIRVAHGTDIQQVKETLIEVARNHPNVHDDPPPHVLLMDFADDAIKLELRYFVDFGEGLGTKDGLLTEIDSAFRERGIVFAMPRLDIDLPRRTPSKRSDDASGPTGEVPPIP